MINMLQLTVMKMQIFLILVLLLISMIRELSFLPGGGAVCLWGRGGPEIFGVVKGRGRPFFFSWPKGSNRIFESQRGRDQNFFSMKSVQESRKTGKKSCVNPEKHGILHGKLETDPLYPPNSSNVVQVISFPKPILKQSGYFAVLYYP